jgi:hypothetical protein
MMSKTRDDAKSGAVPASSWSIASATVPPCLALSPEKSKQQVKDVLRKIGSFKDALEDEDEEAGSEEEQKPPEPFD